MTRLFCLALVGIALLASGCQTDKGSREFKPGQGWVPMRP